MNMLKKYAHLLVDYCLDLKKGEKLYISSSTLAEPLIREVYRKATAVGAYTEVDLSFREQSNIFFAEADDELLQEIPVFKEKALSSFDAYLNIRAPHNLMENQSIDPAKKKTRQAALKKLNDIYFTRTGDGSMKRSLCQYPTQANAQKAGMSLEEYESFIHNACGLYTDDPVSHWLEVRRKQQKLVDLLNTASSVRYINDRSDISFSVKGRTWINSDGRTNMPSGEVFSGPVENSVNGTIHFHYPSVFMGSDVEGITLEVKDGEVVKWSAEKGGDVLDQVFQIDGAKYFGEVAIGTNYNIQRPTKNILFDEKIGGTIHMAVGQSYKQTGGLNQSSIHWDMISDMRNGGSIIVDGEEIYSDGFFLNGLLD